MTEPARLKLAELTSALGALVLGIGLGALAAAHLRRVAVPVLLGGILIHAWGMVDKRRIEVRAATRTRWADALYWVCWAFLAALIAYVAWAWATGHEEVR